jgi:hypothetical protein
MTQPAYFATKYDSARDEVIALLADATEGYGRTDDTSGDVDAPTGWFALVVIPDDVCLAGPAMSSIGLDAEIAKLAGTFGVTPADVAGVHIVQHDSQGFVHVETYAEEVTARRDFDCASHRYNVWSEDDWNDGDPLTDEDGWFDCPVKGHGRHHVTD